MTEFQNHNLIELVEHIRDNPETEREFLDSLPKVIRKEVIHNYSAILNAALPAREASTSRDIDMCPSDSPYTSPW